MLFYDPVVLGTGQNLEFRDRILADGDVLAVVRACIDIADAVNRQFDSQYRGFH